MANFLDRPQGKDEPLQNIWRSGQESKKSFFSPKKITFGVVFVLIMAALALGTFFLLGQKTSDVSLEENLGVQEEKIERSAETENKLPELGTADSSTEKYRSENFQISYISFGGNTAVASGKDEKLAIEIYGVKAEPFLNESDNEPKISISWKSNKLTTSELTYSLAGGGGAETINEEGFGFTHGIILDSLEAGSPYIFSIRSSDHWGNSKTFGYYGTYSSARAESIFELIGKTLGETFGWVVGRD